MVDWKLAIYPAVPSALTAAARTSKEGEPTRREGGLRPFELGLAARGLVLSKMSPASPAGAPPLDVWPSPDTPERGKRFAEVLACIARSNLAVQWKEAIGPRWLPRTAPEHTPPCARFRHTGVELPPHIRPAAPRPMGSRFAPAPPRNPAIALAEAVKAQVAPHPRAATGPAAISAPKNRKARGTGS